MNENNKEFVKFIVLGVLLIIATIHSEARLKSDNNKLPYKTPSATADPWNQLRVHKVGNMWLSITNYGQFGAEGGRSIRDECTGQFAPSCQFPAGSGIEYLFIGAIWIGAVVNDTDTLVSVGFDGWQSVLEFNAPNNVPVTSRTIRPSGYQYGTCFTPFSDSAHSELDYIAVYYDTVTDPNFVYPDPIDGPHKPLNLEVTQKSYSWSYDYAKDFVLFDYLIKNIGTATLNNVYIGLYIDGDAHNPDLDPGGFTDDVSGYKLRVPSIFGMGYQDTVNLAWISDNNGLSSNGLEGNPPIFRDDVSPTSVTGVRVLNSPNPDLKFSFNWWVSNGNPQLDFGPWRQENLARRPNYFDPNNQSGTPEGDRSKYFIMRNNEFDYDQLSAALADIWERQGWVNQSQISPPNLADIANGFDTRYLLSFGPFNIDPGDSLPLTLGYVAGKEFHADPTDFDGYTATDSTAVFNFYNKLDFTAFGVNAQWAAWVYDNPGVDTDHDGYKGKFRIIQGDTVYYTGDGVPDFKGPPPPEFPRLVFETSTGKVKIKWNGRITETSLDPFTNEADFEGYRIWLSYTGIVGDFNLLNSYDKIDYRLHYWDKGRKKWVYKLPSLSLDSLKALFLQDDPCLGFRPCPLETLAFCLDPNNCTENDVLRWTKSHPYVYQGTQIDTFKIAPNLTLRAGDSIYFDIQDWNRDLLDIKTYKDSILGGKIGPDDNRYYEYEYIIDNLDTTKPVYVAVTAFDYGHPLTDLPSLETSVLSNSTLVYPLNCFIKPGDANGDNKILLSDIVTIINFLFRGQLAPDPLCRADANADGNILLADIVYLVNFLFRSGPAPLKSRECCL